MRYRPEQLDDELVIRNVETDLVLGSVLRPCINNPHDPKRLIFLGCTVRNKEGVEIAMIPTATVENPLREAAVAVANYEEWNGYPGFRGRAKRAKPATAASCYPLSGHRIEFLLGTVLADAASAIARGFIEYHNGGLKAETKERYTGLIVQLYRIWFASRFDSFDGERRVHDAYFASTPGSRPRMSFAAAAQHYGMNELRTRFPDASEATLKELLSLPLEMLERTLNSLVPARTGLSGHRRCSR